VEEKGSVLRFVLMCIAEILQMLAASFIRMPERVADELNEVPIALDGDRLATLARLRCPVTRTPPACHVSSSSSSPGNDCDQQASS